MRAAATAAALLIVLALAPAGIALHEHDADLQAADHAQCGACCFRHLPGVETDGAPVTSAPDLVAGAVVTDPPAGERTADPGVGPTRGPPA